MYWKQILTIVLALFIFTTNAGFCGDLKIVDKTNYQEIEGMVPDPVVEWFKRGDFMMRVGELNYDPAEAIPTWMTESFTENVGKYELNEDTVIVDVKTGNTPEFIKGIPFPEIKKDDPMAPAKIMFNGNFVRQVNGPHRDQLLLTLMDGKTRKLERFIKVMFYTYPYTAWEGARDIPNPDKLEFKDQVLIKEPYDMAGTSLMTWRYLDNREDMLFGYIPAIRRVRRLTPASRSDALFGTDMARDDANYNAFDGKIGDVEWRLIGEGEILVSYASQDQLPIVINEKGEWTIDLTNRRKYAAYGYEEYAKDYYKGDVAPWCQTSNVWVKRPVWIVEGRHKDSYYNYGRQIHWMDKETFQVHWKQIFDRSDEYWKMLYYTWSNAKSEKGSERGIMYSSNMIDERTYHGTAQDIFCDNCYYVLNAIGNSADQFSLSGFTKLSK